MDHATIHGKVPRDVRDDEDLLTSTAFGLLELAASPRILVEWLRCARNLDGQPPDLAGEYDHAAFAFWPRFPELHDRTEIDLLLSLHRADESADLVAVEVKFRSGPSGGPPVGREVNPDICGQLGREWNVLARMPAARAPGTPRTIRSRRLFYITPDARGPRGTLEAMVGELREKADDPSADHMRASLFWLSWLDLTPILRHTPVTAAPRSPERRVVERLQAYLVAQQLQSMMGFPRAVPTGEVSWSYAPPTIDWQVSPAARLDWAYGARSYQLTPEPVPALPALYTGDSR